MSEPTLIQSSMIADEIRARFPRLVSSNGHRLEDAAIIASSPEAVSGCRLEGYKVRSQSNAAGAYLVDPVLHECTCPDHGAHSAAGIVCKHRLAVYIWETFQERSEAAAPAPTPAGPFYEGQEIAITRGPAWSQAYYNQVPRKFSARVVAVQADDDGKIRRLVLSAQDCTPFENPRYEWTARACLTPWQLFNGDRYHLAAI